VPDDLAAIGPFFAVSAHPRGAVPAPPWRSVSELTAPSRALRERIASVRATLAARGGLDVDAVEPRVAASAVHLGLAARLIAPALGAAVIGRPVDMRPGGLWWQDVYGGPVPLSVPALPGGEGPGRAPGEEHRGGRPAVQSAPLAADWGRLLFAELLAPLVAAVARLVPVSGRVLWGNVASAVNAAAAQVARQRPDLAASAWQAAGGLFASPWLRGEPNPPGPAFRRSSCCLFYRLALSSRPARTHPQARRDPAAVCGDCVLAGTRS
jgi:hypothetical protein